MNVLEIQTLACGAWEWFQQALVRLCVCVAAVLIVVLILRTQTVRDAAARLASLWRDAAHFTRLVVLALVSVFAIYAGTKTNSPPLGTMMPLLPPLPQSVLQTVTPDEIAQGWRLENVTTNDAISYAMPTNGVEYLPWSLRGGRETHFPLDLVEFAFPFGTNVVRRLDVVSGGMVDSFPRPSCMSICAAREYASIIPGVGRFWWTDAAAGLETQTYQAKLLTWENVFAGRDRTGLYSAQIELWSDGNFVTRSNNVESVYRRINPDDWDDDGLANERDLNPCSSDGDFFGVANAMPEGANFDAYYWLDICATGALDCATVRATCDGPSALGDHVVIVRTNQVCHLPLLAGAVYAVQSTLPISLSTVSSEHASITTNSATSLTVSLPLEFSFAPARAESVFILNTSPIDVGASLVSVTGGCCSCNTNGFGFAWMCPDSCSCRGANEHTLSSEVLWEGYSLLFYWRQYCPCYYVEQEALSEIGERGVSLTILDVTGNVIEWKDPILVGEAIKVEVTVGGEEMLLQDFITLFNGRLRLRAWTVDFDGTHDVIEEPIPVSASTTTALENNVFRVSVSAEWLSGGGFASNTEDGRFAKTSIDADDAVSGEGNRQDSDAFDANTAGRLHGRARGKTNGNASATIPEGAFNLRTVKAAGTASLEARAGSSSSSVIQMQRQADLFYYSGHGEHRSGILGLVAGPSDVSNHWYDVDTVVFAGCSVLDIGDQNNNYSASVDHNANPGLKWLKVSGASVLLGYAYKAPTDNQGGTAIVQSWCAARGGLDDVEAWMLANDDASGHNACAIRRTDQNTIEYSFFRRSSHDVGPVHIYNSYKRESITMEVE